MSGRSALGPRDEQKRPKIKDHMALDTGTLQSKLMRLSLEIS